LLISTVSYPYPECPSEAATLAYKCGEIDGNIDEHGFSAIFSRVNRTGKLGACAILSSRRRNGQKLVICSSRLLKTVL
jgi:hypothetical protein